MSVREPFMTFYGDGTGLLIHLAEYGMNVALCGAQIAPASRAYCVEEKPATCPKCRKEHS